MRIEIPVSLGELCDKITILELKLKFIQDEKKLQNIRYEHNCLNAKLYKVFSSEGLPEVLTRYMKELQEVNQDLWNLEEDIRKNHKRANIGIARYISALNDIRADIKYRINYEFDSDIVEEKSYE